MRMFAVVYEEHEGSRVAAASVFEQAVGRCDHTVVTSKAGAVCEVDSRGIWQLQMLAQMYRYSHM
jgi:hypothetical protein